MRYRPADARSSSRVPSSADMLIIANDTTTATASRPTATNACDRFILRASLRDSGMEGIAGREGMGRALFSVYRFITLASRRGNSCCSSSSMGTGRASDQLGHAVVVPGMFGRSMTDRASSSVARMMRDGALASAA